MMIIPWYLPFTYYLSYFFLMKNVNDKVQLKIQKLSICVFPWKCAFEFERSVNFSNFCLLLQNNLKYEPIHIKEV